MRSEARHYHRYLTSRQDLAKHSKFGEWFSPDALRTWQPNCYNPVLEYELLI